MMLATCKLGGCGLGAYTGEYWPVGQPIDTPEYRAWFAAPYGYDAAGNKIAPYGKDVMGRPVTGVSDPNYDPYAADLARMAAAAGGGASRSTTSTGGSMMPVTVSIENLTRPGAGNFYVGDRWRITAHGEPNMPVSVRAGSTNQATSTASYGTTNTAGVFTLEGAMGTGEIGRWQEVWSVGSINASPTLNFDVVAAPQQQQQRQSGQQQSEQQQQSTPEEESLLDELTGKLPGGLADVNPLILAGGAAAILFLFMRGSK